MPPQNILLNVNYVAWRTPFPAADSKILIISKGHRTISEYSVKILWGGELSRKFRGKESKHVGNALIATHKVSQLKYFRDWMITMRSTEQLYPLMKVVYA